MSKALYRLGRVQIYPGGCKRSIGSCGRFTLILHTTAFPYAIVSAPGSPFLILDMTDLF